MKPKDGRSVLLALLTILTAAGTAVADDWKSAEATRALLQRLDASQAQAIAVRDPDHPERFIAALRVPGQLLVVYQPQTRTAKAMTARSTKVVKAARPAAKGSVKTAAAAARKPGKR